MNAIEDNAFSRAFRQLGKELPRPRAVLCVSAHWWTEGSLLTAAPQPRTIHDFGGFPPALHAVQYPAPGDPALAEQVRALLDASGAAAAPVELDLEWGLDHGAWSVLIHLYPEADVPVVQLSLDARLSGAGHLALGQTLRPLRDEGVMILGSGNITHNLSDAFAQMGASQPVTPAWARAYEAAATAALEARDSEALLALWPDGPDARQAHPHPDHWFPLLYAYGASDAADTLRFPVEGFDLGSLSMRAALWEA
ncbi:MAG: 4,5-DOPA dioxygenase extradiol [Planctomycetes bacterium]|nr:4,5-DOPA dioxygenase extradiol [Planctomycetota bacterium]